MRQRYRYDSGNQRVIKETLDPAGTPAADGGPPGRVALYVFPGSFERRGLERGLTTYEPAPAGRTETQYGVAGARIVWQHGAPFVEQPIQNRRITVGIGDLLGTTAAVLPLGSAALTSGELLEARTYYRC